MTRDFNGTKRKANLYRAELLEAFSKVLESGEFLGGSQASSLEQRLSGMLPGGSVLTTASGHDSILMALQSLSSSPDDEIIFPVNSYPTSFPVALSGMKPVPVDCDANGQIDIAKLKQTITPRTKAVVAVHLYGHMADMEALCDAVADKAYIIEDCAQAFGASRKGRPAGTWGDISCFSFYPTKNLGTLGDGGAVWTNHPLIYERMIHAKAYGEKERYKSYFVSGHSRLPELQAAALHVFLDHFAEETEKRRALFALYKQYLNQSKAPVRLLESTAGDHAPHLLVISAPRRNALQSSLKKNGIPTAIHYPVPVHLLPAFAHLQGKRGDFPAAEKLCGSILSLPFHPYMDEQDVSEITSHIRAFYE